MFTPIVFTAEPAARQLGHEVTARKAGKAWEQVLQTEQNSSTDRGDSACPTIIPSINIMTTQQDHFILFSLPDKTCYLRRQTTEGRMWTSACAGESRPGQCSLHFVSIAVFLFFSPHKMHLYQWYMWARTFSHRPRRSWTRTSTFLRRLQRRRKRHRHQREPRYLIFNTIFYFRKTVSFYVKLILALFYLRNPLRSVRWLCHLGWSTRKCLLLLER